MNGFINTVRNSLVLNKCVCVTNATIMSAILLETIDYLTMPVVANIVCMTSAIMLKQLVVYKR